MHAFIFWPVFVCDVDFVSVLLAKLGFYFFKETSLHRDAPLLLLLLEIKAGSKPVPPILTPTSDLSKSMWEAGMGGLFRGGRVGVFFFGNNFCFCQKGRGGWCSVSFVNGFCLLRLWEGWGNEQSCWTMCAETPLPPPLRREPPFLPPGPNYKRRGLSLPACFQMHAKRWPHPRSSTTRHIAGSLL